MYLELRDTRHVSRTVLQQEWADSIAHMDASAQAEQLANEWYEQWEGVDFGVDLPLPPI